jgi:hypothetical protein
VETKGPPTPKKRRGKAKGAPLAEMFTLTTLAEKSDARLYVVGRPSRKQATCLLNIPVSQALKNRLTTQIVGSLAMGTGALLQWALQELDRQGILLEATVEKDDPKPRVTATKTTPGRG